MMAIEINADTRIVRIDSLNLIIQERRELMPEEKRNEMRRYRERKAS